MGRRPKGFRVGKCNKCGEKYYYAGEDINLCVKHLDEIEGGKKNG